MQLQRFVLRMTAATTADGTCKKQRYQNLIGQKYVCKVVAPLAAKKTGTYAPALPFSVLLCGKIPHVTSPPFGRDTMRQALLRRFFLPTPTHPLFRLPFCKRRARYCPWQTFLFRPWFTPSPVYPFHLAFRFPKGSAVPQRCGIKYCQQLIRRIRRCLENVLDMTSKCIPLRDII